jgi:flagellar motility protein MotE (MotC chaperone)
MRLIYLLLVASLLLGAQDEDKLFECTKIFKDRKSELLVELERIDEEKQALEALKIATNNLLKKKKVALDLQEEEVNKKLKTIKQKEASVKKMLEENKKVLKELKKLKMSKIAQTYSKMKASSAANIISKLPDDEAVKILRELKPKTVGQIFAKMEPKKASSLTQLLAK